MESCLFGTMIWGGEYEGMPAVVGSWYGGAALYVFKDRKWKVLAKDDNPADVTPHKCKECGTQLPLTKPENSKKNETDVKDGMS